MVWAAAGRPAGVFPFLMRHGAQPGQNPVDEPQEIRVYAERRSERGKFPQETSNWPRSAVTQSRRRGVELQPARHRGARLNGPTAPHAALARPPPQDPVQVPQEE